MEHFKPFPVDGLSSAQAHRVHRLNCLGSLFYFNKIALRRVKNTALHFQLCLLLEAEHIKDLIEWPRDHYKTTNASEGRTMWGALPFGKQDEDAFVKLGMSNEFIRWMNKVHNPFSRTLVVAENITNASKIGLRIRKHYESNAVYRSLFPETLPDSTCIWGANSLHIRRPPGRSQLDFSPNGEGTFDFLGVGGALQSRHYDFLIQDDLVGRKAIESLLVMEKTFEYHQLLVGAFDSEDPNHENNELVIGNRWGFHDLNSYIREHEPWFKITSHSALGGCCVAHPPDQPIFPEQFSFDKLMRLKDRLGSYFFSCQYLNNPAAPENADFQAGWLNLFTLKFPFRDGYIEDAVIEYEVKDGIVRQDKSVRKLSITVVVDPAHSGNAGHGRCRHAVVVVGVDRDGNYYVLDAWAMQASYDTFYNKIFELAEKWFVHKIGVESVAAQKFVLHHIESMNRDRDWKLRCEPLRGEVELESGEVSKRKLWRIFNVIAPVAERGQLFVNRRCQDFLEEYKGFSTVVGKQGKFIDQLDAFAYAPQILRTPSRSADHRAAIAANRERMHQVNRPYSMPTSSGSEYIN